MEDIAIDITEDVAIILAQKMLAADGNYGYTTLYKIGKKVYDLIPSKLVFKTPTGIQQWFHLSTTVSKYNKEIIELKYKRN